MVRSRVPKTSWVQSTIHPRTQSTAQDQALNPCPWLSLLNYEMGFIKKSLQGLKEFTGQGPETKEGPDQVSAVPVIASYWFTLPLPAGQIWPSDASKFLKYQHDRDFAWKKKSIF